MSDEKSKGLSGWITFTISIVAFLMSSFTFYRSVRYEMRPRIEVTSAALEADPHDSVKVRFKLGLKNLGKSAATNVVVSSDWDVSDFDVPVGGQLFEHPRVADMEPDGPEKKMTFQSNRFMRFVQDDLQRPKAMLLIFGNVVYTDEVTGILRKKDWCFVREVNNPKLKGILEMEPCEYQFQSKQ